jgi:hypothetical protein
MMLTEVAIRTAASLVEDKAMAVRKASVIPR